MTPPVDLPDPFASVVKVGELIELAARSEHLQRELGEYHEFMRRLTCLIADWREGRLKHESNV